VILEYYFEEEEEEEEQQQQPASAEVAITKNGQQINPTALPSVFFSRPKKGHSAPDVTWTCAWCPVAWNVTQK
jgi:hypothetical protein